MTTESEWLAEYVRAICGGRLIEPRLRNTLYQLLAVPRVRERFPNLTEHDFQEAADRQVQTEEEVLPRRRQRKTA